MSEDVHSIDVANGGDRENSRGDDSALSRRGLVRCDPRANTLAQERIGYKRIWSHRRGSNVVRGETTKIMSAAYDG
jgi:hypothetical protein